MSTTKIEGGKFLIDIKNSNDGTWQGTITWMEKDKSEVFRSATEMLHLIQSAVEKQKK